LTKALKKAIIIFSYSKKGVNIVKKFNVVSTVISKLLKRGSGRNAKSLIKKVSQPKIIENLCNEGRIHSGNLPNSDK